MREMQEEVLDRTWRAMVVRFFYKAMAVLSALYGGYLLWDFLTLLPWFRRMTGLAGENTFALPFPFVLAWYCSVFFYHFSRQYDNWANQYDPLADLRDLGIMKYSLYTFVAVFTIPLILREYGAISRLPYTLYYAGIALAPVLLGAILSSDCRSSDKNKSLVDRQMLLNGLERDYEFRKDVLLRADVSDVFETKVHDYLKRYDFITPRICMEQFDINEKTARAMLEQMEKQDDIRMTGMENGEPEYVLVYYTLTDEAREELEEKKKKEEGREEA